MYTKTGDKGTTSLLTGERVEKDSLRVEAYGTVDEISSVLGMARALCQQVVVKTQIYELQKILMLVMADLASNKPVEYVTAAHIKQVEDLIDQWEAALPPLRAFVIPGDSAGEAALHTARTTTRRAERQVLRLAKQEPVDEILTVFLNRLSDACFMLARAENHSEQ